MNDKTEENTDDVLPKEEKTAEEQLLEARQALENIIVAIRGGGDLNPAADEAQAFLNANDKEAAEAN